MKKVLTLIILCYLVLSVNSSYTDTMDYGLLYAKLSHNDKYLIAINTIGVIKVWNLQKNELINEYREWDKSAYEIFISEDEKFLIAQVSYILPPDQIEIHRCKWDLKTGWVIDRTKRVENIDSVEEREKEKDNPLDKYCETFNLDGVLLEEALPLYNSQSTRAVVYKRITGSGFAEKKSPPKGTIEIWDVNSKKVIDAYDGFYYLKYSDSEILYSKGKTLYRLNYVTPKLESYNGHNSDILSVLKEEMNIFSIEKNGTILTSVRYFKNYCQLTV